MNADYFKWIIWSPLLDVLLDIFQMNVLIGRENKRQNGEKNVRKKKHEKRESEKWVRNHLSYKSFWSYTKRWSIGVSCVQACSNGQLFDFDIIFPDVCFPFVWPKISVTFIFSVFTKSLMLMCMNECCARTAQNKKHLSATNTSNATVSSRIQTYRIHK